MERGLRSVVKDIPIGKILIQTEPSTGEPQLHYCKLPEDIASRYVLISDAQIATGTRHYSRELGFPSFAPLTNILFLLSPSGAAALMAIRVILDHDVPQDRILFLSLIASPLGIHTIANAFPQVKVVTAEVDIEVDELGHVVPGFGNFGDRYFGTGG